MDHDSGSSHLKRQGGRCVFSKKKKKKKDLFPGSELPSSSALPHASQLSQSLSVPLAEKDKMLPGHRETLLMSLGWNRKDHG